MTALTLWAMTLATGLCIGNIYFNQPLLPMMQAEFGVSTRAIAWVPTLTQVGYASGMLFLIPLGDMFERRRLIVIATFTSGLAMAAVAWAPSFGVLVAACAVMGITTMTPQFIVPFAAHIAPPERRGQVVGTIMSGLLLGVLLARTVSGLVGGTFGWRVMFSSAAAAEVLLAVALWRLLPTSEPTYHGRYRDLLKSVGNIVREQPVLREAALFGAMLFGSFSAFWATLSFLLQTPAFNLGPREAGLFGILGAVGALVPPFVGRMADKSNPRQTTGWGLAVAVVSFLIFFVSATSLWGLALGVLVMDIGVQMGHVSNQSRIFILVPEARSRINTAYMFSYFVGGALGSWLASMAWSLTGWQGVCAVGLGMQAVGVWVFARGRSAAAATR